MNYKFYFPVNVIFNIKSIDLLNSYILPERKIMIVCGKKSIKETGLLKKIKNLLSKNNIFIFDRIYKEPDINIVDTAVKFAKENKIEVIIGIGGGSVIDTSKAVSVLVNENNFTTVMDYLEIDGHKQVCTEKIKMIAIPTVSGSGAEVTRNSVIYNPLTKTKRSFRNDCIFPDIAIIDPELTLTVPAKQTAISGLDALCHLTESFLSKKSNQFTDILCIEGIKLVINSLEKLIYDLNNLQLRENISQASVLGGIVISNSGLTFGHGIGAVIGPRFNLPHGLSCGILLPEVINFSFNYLSKEKQRILTELFGNKPSERVKKILLNLNLPDSFTEFHIKETDLINIVDTGITASSTKATIVELTKEQLLNILKNCI